MGDNLESPSKQRKVTKLEGSVEFLKQDLIGMSQDVLHRHIVGNLKES